MKKIDIEKTLDLVDVVDIISLDMKDSFTYQKEEDGLRCIGPFYIHGRYSTLNEVKNFHDVFEFDIFAAQEKLDGEAFRMQCMGYDYSLINGVKLILHFDVYGISDAKDTVNNYSEVEMFDLRDSQPAAVAEDEISLEEIQTLDALLNDPTTTEYELPDHTLDALLNGNDSMVAKEESYVLEVSEERSIDEVEEEAKPVDAVDLSMMEELFDDKDNVITSYSFVVVKPEDSYESIAHRYGVNSQELREINHDKMLQAKQLIVLPYGSVSSNEAENS